MTKTVRIENADNNPDVHLIVDVIENGVLINTVYLTYPTQLETFCLYQGKTWHIREEHVSL